MIPDLSPHLTRRIVIVGLPGAGKTTLARQLSHRLGIPHIELTRLRWQAGWVKVDRDCFRAHIAQTTQGETWIVEGTYRQVRYVDMRRATLVIWLDYALSRILARLVRRTLWHWLSHREFSPGNPEHLGRLIGRESVVWALLRDYHAARRDYARQVQQANYAHLIVLRLRTPWETRRLLHNFGS